MTGSEVQVIQAANASLNNFNAVSNGCSLGSAGDLSPPESPMVAIPDDAFSSQTPLRGGEFASGNLIHIPELSYIHQQLMGLAKLPGVSGAGSSVQSSALPLTPSPENPKVSPNQSTRSSQW